MICSWTLEELGRALLIANLAIHRPTVGYQQNVKLLRNDTSGTGKFITRDQFPHHEFVSGQRGGQIAPLLIRSMMRGKLRRGRHVSLGLLVWALVTGSMALHPARAVQDPRPGRYDARVRTVPYNAMNVVRVIGGTLSSTQIIFSPTETVTQVAIGDSEAWLAQPAGNLLFLKPTEARANTNAQVVTKRGDGSFRSYQFELVARAASITQPAEGAQFAIAFTYPEDARQAAIDDRRKRQGDADERLAQQRLALGILDGPRNWRYVAQGSTTIQPAEVSDNGRMTAFRFPGNQSLPTIYTVAADGQETIVPYTTAGEVLIVQTTAREFRLRQGNEALCVFNLAFNPIGWTAGTGTTAPDVTRTVRGNRP